jgi:hypothetical protein
MRTLLTVALALALVGCKPKQPAVLHIDPALESLVPSDTVFVVGANLEAVRDTPVYKKLLSQMPLPQLDQFTQQTGLDPRKDLSQILSCSDGKHALLFARGKFNRSDLDARLQKQGAAPITYKNYRLFGNEQGAVFFLNDSTGIAGPAQQLRAIIDHPSSGGMPPALRELLRTLPPGDQIYAASSSGFGGLNIATPPNSNLASVLQALRSVQTVTLGMDLSNGLNAVAEATCATERDAKFVHDMVKGIVGLGRLNTPDNQPDLLKLYDAIQVTQQGTHTQAKADIPQQLADKFLDLWLKR